MEFITHENSTGEMSPLSRDVTPRTRDKTTDYEEENIYDNNIDENEIGTPYSTKSIQSINTTGTNASGISLSEIETAIGVLRSNGQNKITVLHCNTEYPTPMVDVNLRAMQTIGTAFNVEIGYSDHTLGIEVPIAAVALGARVIEKHFTLDRNMEGPDHRASLEPDELKQMVSSIRNIERALGSTIKQPSKSELKNKDIARKSIVANHNIKKGDILTVNTTQP